MDPRQEDTPKKREFVQLVFIPNGIEKAQGYIERGREILRRQVDFWRRYAAIEDVYAKGLQNLLTLPCVTWEEKGGLFGKKQVFHDNSALQNAWDSVRKSVEQLAIRHTNKAEALFQQGYQLNEFALKTENKARSLYEQTAITLSTISANQKIIQRLRQQYEKLAQTHKSTLFSFFLCTHFIGQYLLILFQCIQALSNH